MEQAKLPIKTKIAAWWLIIGSGIMVIYSIISFYIFESDPDLSNNSPPLPFLMFFPLIFLPSFLHFLCGFLLLDTKKKWAWWFTILIPVIVSVLTVPLFLVVSLIPLVLLFVDRKDYFKIDKQIGWYKESKDRFFCSNCFIAENPKDGYIPIKEEDLKKDIYTCDKCGKEIGQNMKGCKLSVERIIFIILLSVLTIMSGLFSFYMLMHVALEASVDMEGEMIFLSIIPFMCISGILWLLRVRRVWKIFLNMLIGIIFLVFLIFLITSMG